VSEATRHLRDTPCPVCGGHAGLAKGRGERCAGFSLDKVAYCTRDECAGDLPIDINTSPPAYKHLLLGACDCGSTHAGGAQGWRTPRPTKAEDVLPLETRHAIFSRALELLELRPEALGDLTRRGLSETEVRSAGYRSWPRRGKEHQRFLNRLVSEFDDTELRRCPGFTDKNDRLNFWTAYRGRDGYVVPYKDEGGRITGLQAKVLYGSYLTARGTKLLNVYHVAGAGAPDADLFLTEGATKANVACSLGGCWVFAVAGQSLAPQHLEAVKRMRPGRAIVALDQEENRNTERARERWLLSLHHAGLAPYHAVWEGC
jgi:hypothetical protein